MNQQFKIVCEGQKFEVNDKILQLTDFFQDIVDFEGRKEEIPVTTYKKQVVKRVLDACKIADYKFKLVTKVNQSDPTAYIGAPLCQFFASLKYDELNDLFRLARHLKIKGLQNNIATYLAAKVYIKLNLDDYNKKKAQLGIKQQLTPERSKALKDKYIFLN